MTLGNHKPGYRYRPTFPLESQHFAGKNYKQEETRISQFCRNERVNQNERAQEPSDIRSKLRDRS